MLAVLFAITTICVFPAIANPVSASIISDLTDYARYAAIAYQTEEAITNWSCAYCLHPSINDARNRTFKSTGISSLGIIGDSEQGYVAVSDSHKSIIFAIRGTADIGSCIADIDLSRIPLPLPGTPPGATVHEGWWNVWTGLRDSGMETAFLELLNDSQNAGYSVTFASHSLGAAASVLAAVEYTARGIVKPSQINIITLGQPRIGNDVFSDHVMNLGFNQILRIVNQNDIIPHILPEFLGFRHPSNELWINWDGELVTCDDVYNAGEDRNCMNTVPAIELSLIPHLNYLGIVPAIPEMQPANP